MEKVLKKISDSFWLLPEVTLLAYSFHILNMNCLCIWQRISLSQKKIEGKVSMCAHTLGYVVLLHQGAAANQQFHFYSCWGSTSFPHRIPPFHKIESPVTWGALVQPTWLTYETTLTGKEGVQSMERMFTTPQGLSGLLFISGDNKRMTKQQKAWWLCSIMDSSLL